MRLKYFLIVLFLTNLAFAGSYWFGNDSGSDYTDLEFTGDYIICGWFVCDSTITVDSMKAPMWPDNSADSIAFAVYSCNSGDLDPDDLIDSTAKAQVTAADQQITMTLNFINNDTISAGDTAWLAILYDNAVGGSGFFYYVDASSGDTIRYAAESVWDIEDFNPTGVAADDKFNIQLWGTVVAGGNPPDTLNTYSADSIRCDYSGENDSIWTQYTTPDQSWPDYVKIAYSTSGYPDSSVADTIHNTFVQDTAIRDTITIEVTETDTVYFSGWVVDADSGWSDRVQWILPLDIGDIYPPDVIDLVDIIRILHINNDSIEVALGSVDSSDYAALIIRGDTASIPTTTSSGWSIYSGSNLENDTSAYFAGVIDTLGRWLYISAFTGDEVPNYSAAVSDSVFWPRGGGAGGGNQNRMFEYLIAIQRRQ